MGASFRAVNLVKMFERELEFSSEGFNSAFEFAFGKGRELVEQRLDDGWIENDHGHLERDSMMWYETQRWMQEVNDSLTRNP